VNYKIVLIALLLITTGSIAAFNSKAIRDGFSPWLTTYIISAITASIYDYQLRANLLPLTTTSVFQHFFFHSSWYFVTIFVLHEQMTLFKSIGLFLAFLGMLLMSVK